MKYRCFTRTWYKPAQSAGWPNNREPHPGKRSYRGHPDRLTYAEAQDYCQRWNSCHNPGPMSRKCEFEEM